jgi:hypothetical protein
MCTSSSGAGGSGRSHRQESGRAPMMVLYISRVWSFPLRGREILKVGDSRKWERGLAGIKITADFGRHCSWT